MQIILTLYDVDEWGETYLSTNFPGLDGFEITPQMLEDYGFCDTQILFEHGHCQIDFSSIAAGANLIIPTGQYVIFCGDPPNPNASWKLKHSSGTAHDHTFDGSCNDDYTNVSIHRHGGASRRAPRKPVGEGLYRKRGGRVNTNSRFSGRSQTNLKGRFKK